MVELVDTLVSGTRARKGVQVQVLFRAKATQRWVAFFLWFVRLCFLVPLINDKYLFPVDSFLS